MRAPTSNTRGLPRKMREYYELAQEQGRLGAHSGLLEFYRTQEVISRHLSKSAKVILDVGGGPGRYAWWLARLGHAVHLVDPVPLHVNQAKAAGKHRGGRLLCSATVGDARSLNFPDRFADIVLLLGPLYHLTNRRLRLKALREAHRTLKPRGLLFVAGISRFASALDGLVRGFVKDPRFFRIVQRDLKNGQHRNPTRHSEYFTTAFFHHPNELRNEVRESGFPSVKLYGLEGPGWLVRDFEKYWNEPKLRERLLKIIRSVETEPTLIGQSAHILAVARKR